MNADYFAGLSEDERAKLRRTINKYVPLIPGAQLLAAGEAPTFDLLREVLPWQELEAETLEAHNDWLLKVKASIERTGREYNRQSFLRYCALREVE